MKRTELKRRTPLKRGPMKRPLSARFLASQRANAAKRVYTRTGEMLTCETCKREFYATPFEVRRKRRFCSRACMGWLSRTIRTCTICGAQFMNKGPKKTCSVRCCNEAKRRSKTGPNNPLYKDGAFQARKRWRASRESTCQICDSNQRLVVHHVVLEQHVRKRGGDVFDIRNGLTLCWRCHANHHHGGSRIAVKYLRPENFEFASELLGPAVDDYFVRYYEDDLFETAKVA